MNVLIANNSFMLKVVHIPLQVRKIRWRCSLLPEAIIEPKSLFARRIWKISLFLPGLNKT
jgi:hypothetical protein